MDNFNIQKFFKDQYLTEDYTSEYDEKTAKRNAFAASYNRPGDTERFRNYMEFLSKLRTSGKTNMFGAAPYLQAEFNLEKKEARDLLAYWMGSYRNPDSDESLNENFEMGDRVKLTPDYEETPDEVFTITQTSGNKYFIADEDGRGWYTYGDQLVMADDELDEVELTQDFGELDEDHTKAENKKLKKIKKELDGASKMHKKQASIIKKIVKEIREFQQPKSFDPDTIRLVREMLEAADIHYNELVEGDGEVSSFLDKRSGGTYFKFPHFNGGPGMFGKATVDRIERSKAAAKQAALKTYTQFKEYIEDYEIGDASPTGVYGSVYLFVMFNDLAEDYSAPKGGTQSSQFENINDPVLMRARAARDKKPEPSRGGLDLDDVLYLRDDKKDLEDRIAQLYREMEQDAEPEGGPIADQYADELDKLENKLYRVTKQINNYDMNESLNESLNPEVSKAVNNFIKAMAKRYDYSEQDAVFAIMAALKQRMMDGIKEGSCGYTPDGKSRSKPASSDLIKLKEKLEQVNEKLCKKGEAYRKRRMAAGEKSSAYLSGRAVKVCKGQMSGKKKK